MINTNKIICCDYYSTLVVLDKPFDILKEWVKNHLANHNLQIDSNQFFSKFNRYRAKMYSDLEYRLGIDVLLECFKNTCTFYNINCFNDEIKPVIEEIFTSPPAYPDAHEFVHQARQFYQVGLLTNADNYLLYKSIEKNKFDFDFIITSDYAQSNKPDRKIFEYAMKYLGARNKDIIMIGDSQVDDVLGAGQTGIKTVWINRCNEKLKDGIIPPYYEATSLIDAFTFLNEYEKGLI